MPPVDVDGEQGSVACHDGYVVTVGQVSRPSFGVRCGRHQDDALCSAERSLGVQQEGKTEVAGKVAFVNLVEDDDSNPGKVRVVLQPAGENSFGEDLDSGGRADDAFIAGLVADRLADFFSEHVRHAAGSSARGKFARLEDDDSLRAVDDTTFEQPKWRESRLSRAGWCDENATRVRRQCVDELGDARFDRKPGRREGHTRAGVPA